MAGRPYRLQPTGSVGSNRLTTGSKPLDQALRLALPRPQPMEKQRSRRKHKGRRESGTFLSFPHAVMDSPNWRRCSATAIKLLCDLARQYNGHNNGDLCAALSMLRSRGWSSPETVVNAHRELEHYGLIMLTKQGSLFGPSLYALTWQPIDECGGKLDTSATKVAPGLWKSNIEERFRRPPKNRKSSTDSEVVRYSIRSDRCPGQSASLRHP